MSNAAGYLVADPLLAAAWHCRESTYEYGIQDNTGALQGAFGPGCWRWWGTAIVPVNEWTHVGAGVDGTNEKHSPDEFDPKKDAGVNNPESRHRDKVLDQICDTHPGSPECKVFDE